MKQELQNWLHQNALNGNLLASALRFPDRSIAVQSRFDTFSQDKVDQAVRTVADLLQTLQMNRLDFGRIRWIYQNALFYCERRADGILFCVFTSRDLTVDDATEVERLFTEFKSMKNAAPL